MKSREVLTLLQENGWYVVAQKGSHMQLKHVERPGKTTLPAGNSDLPKGTLASIERQSGVELREESRKHRWEKKLTTPPSTKTQTATTA